MGAGRNKKFSDGGGAVEKFSDGNYITHIAFLHLCCLFFLSFFPSKYNQKNMGESIQIDTQAMHDQLFPDGPTMQQCKTDAERDWADPDQDFGKELAAIMQKQASKLSKEIVAFEVSGQRMVRSLRRRHREMAKCRDRLQKLESLAHNDQGWWCRSCEVQALFCERLPHYRGQVDKLLDMDGSGVCTVLCKDCVKAGAEDKDEWICDRCLSVYHNVMEVPEIMEYRGDDDDTLEICTSCASDEKSL